MPEAGASRRRFGLTLHGIGARPLPPRKRFWRQVSNHSVALISLVLAATSFGYNTWRNEVNEIQRNLRQASFQVLIEVGELNQIVLYRRYFQTPADGAESNAEHAINRIQDAQSWVAGWGKVTMIRDLTSFMPAPLPKRGRALFESWSEHAGDLDEADPIARREAEQALLGAIESLRAAMIALIDSLR